MSQTALGGKTIHNMSTSSLSRRALPPPPLTLAPLPSLAKRARRKASIKGEASPKLEIAFPQQSTQSQVQNKPYQQAQALDRPPPSASLPVQAESEDDEPVHRRSRASTCHQCCSPYVRCNLTYDVTDGQEFVLQEALDSADAEFWYTDDAATTNSGTSVSLSHNLSLGHADPIADGARGGYNARVAGGHQLQRESSYSTFGRVYADMSSADARSDKYGLPPSDTSVPNSAIEESDAHEDYQKQAFNRSAKGKRRATNSYERAKREHQDAQKNTTTRASTTPSEAERYAKLHRITTLNTATAAAHTSTDSEADAYPSDAADVVDVDTAFSGYPADEDMVDDSDDSDDSDDDDLVENDERRVSITPASPSSTRTSISGYKAARPLPIPPSPSSVHASRASPSATAVGSSPSTASQGTNPRPLTILTPIQLWEQEPFLAFRGSFVSFEKEFDPKFFAAPNEGTECKPLTPTRISRPFAQLQSDLLLTHEQADVVAKPEMPRRGATLAPSEESARQQHATASVQAASAPSRTPGASSSISPPTTFKRNPAPAPRFFVPTEAVLQLSDSESQMQSQHLQAASASVEKDLPPLPPPVSAPRALHVRSSRFLRTPGFRPGSALAPTRTDLAGQSQRNLHLAPPAAAVRQGDAASAPESTSVSGVIAAAHRVPPPAPSTSAASATSAAELEELKSFPTLHRSDISGSSVQPPSMKGDFFPWKPVEPLSLSRQTNFGALVRARTRTFSNEKSEDSMKRVKPPAVGNNSQQGPPQAPQQATPQAPSQVTQQATPQVPPQAPQQASPKARQHAYAPQHAFHVESAVSPAPRPSRRRVEKILPLPLTDRTTRRRSRPFPLSPDHIRDEVRNSNSIWRAPQWQPPRAKSRMGTSIRIGSVRQTGRQLSNRLTRRRQQMLCSMPDDDDSEVEEVNVALSRMVTRTRKGSISSITESVENALAPFRKAIADVVHAAAAKSGNPLSRMPTVRMATAGEPSKPKEATSPACFPSSQALAESDAEEDWPAPSLRGSVKRHPRYDDDLPPLPPASPDADARPRKSLYPFEYLSTSIIAGDSPPPLPFNTLASGSKEEPVITEAASAPSSLDGHHRSRVSVPASASLDGHMKPGLLSSSGGLRGAGFSPSAPIVRTKRWREAYEPGRLSRKRCVSLRVNTDIRSLTQNLQNGVKFQ
ncbi:hypothetical protein K437DRAFT_154608 [Tilletiaria anomala UBC 951]|uniref:Uncharacterized protein n=1 Tax=Tilletiaria anomala (strain ATCC 24038 / CBS 436.72 / UBC 951) TaxID=1037660 RepID=A0A066VNM3_TILAU|nr:uncharacterized protein K437DRAFT_154608 [Tilletiaria anomala UBC 951]KDN43091.1 hypothetical protein K437DRAFT_154608 [Tilletiaria anomala UBC 951]